MNGSDLPLVFHNPPGWPTPSVDWVVAHQGWEPPRGWRPSSSATAAPIHWRFWSRNVPVWNSLTSQAKAPVLRWFWISVVVGVLGVVLSLAGAASGGRFILFWGAILWPIISLIRLPFRLRDINDAAMRHVRETAAQLRRDYEQARYEAHLGGADR